MRQSLRYGTVLLFLSLIAMVATMGTDVAFPLGIGGPLEDVGVLAGVEGNYSQTTLASSRSIAQSDEVDGFWAAASAFAAEEGPAVSLFDSIGDNHDEPGPDRVQPSVVSPPGPSAQTADVVSVEPSSRERLQLEVETVDAAMQEPDPEPEPEPRPLLVTHIVEAGETLWDIARMYDIDVDTILAANETVDPNRLRIGSSLTILTVRGALHTVQRGESMWDISRMYGVSIDEIAQNNGIADPSRLQVQTRLVIPGAQAQAAALRRDAVFADGRLLRNFEWPLQGRISSRYGQRWGRMHHGLDVAVPVGTPTRASAGGRVTYSGAMGTYGIIVIIDHGNGVETRYAHLSRTVARVGQRVQRGELIAYSGNTGHSTGPHLHYEIRLRGQSVNPESYLR